jgi:hypothetical protein
LPHAALVFQRQELRYTTRKQVVRQVQQQLRTGITIISTAAAACAVIHHVASV